MALISTSISRKKSTDVMVLWPVSQMGGSNLQITSNDKRLWGN
jgi:hypothetical protein